MKRTDFRHLPQQPASYRPYIYAIARADGLVKIGRTEAPRWRMESHFDACSRAGVPMTGAYLVGLRDGAIPAAVEARLVSLMHQHGESVDKKREWFTGADPRVVVDLLHEVANAPVSKRKAAKAAA